MDPKEKEQRRARRAMRKYTSAFRFENGREPTTDEDWHPMRRTRALVKEGGASFPSARSSSPQKKGWGAALAGASANGGEREPRRSSEVMTIAAPLKAALAVGCIANAKSILAEGAAPAPAPAPPPPPPGLRENMRVFLTKPKVELYILVSVIMYGMFVFFDLGVGLLAAEWWLVTWSKIIDSAFLLFFVIEICAKLYAFGFKYLTSSPLNMVDALAIILMAAVFVLDDLANALGLMGAGDDEKPTAIQSQGAEGLDEGLDIISVEEKKAKDEKMAGIVLLLRLIRVVRLGAVLVRTMNMTTKMNLSRGQKLTNLSGLKEAIDSKQSGWRGTIVARKWEKIRREESTRPDVDVVKIADDTRDFLQDSQNQDVVKLLTGNFNTLINVFQKLDKTRDGSLDRSEFIPG